MMPDTLTATLRRLESFHGPRFSTNGLPADFWPYFGRRIEVRHTFPDGSTELRRGIVSVSSGWVPVFLLLSRRNAGSSGVTLGRADSFVREIPPRR